jgi:GNAT superfamily N-acetyltransferase
MKYTVRKAQKKDMPQVLALIQELADFEKESNAVKITVPELEKAGFGKNPLFTCFVVDIEGEIPGMALTYSRFSTWVGPTIHLEDLMVTKKMRGTGIGSALYTAVIKHAHQIGVKRVEWVVLDWNSPAINFYEKSGAIVMRDWHTVQMREDGITKFIASNQDH